MRAEAARWKSTQHTLASPGEGSCPYALQPHVHKLPMECAQGLLFDAAAYTQFSSMCDVTTMWSSMCGACLVWVSSPWTFTRSDTTAEKRCIQRRYRRDEWIA